VPQIDRIKEELGWLKVVFGILAATDISLIAWLSQSFGVVSNVKIALTVLLVVLVTGAIVWVNRVAYRKIEQLEKL
jgi:4-hydroxybenzoate polyprenyltransferase